MKNDPSHSSICKSQPRDYNSLQNLHIEEHHLDKPLLDTIENEHDSTHFSILQAPCFLCLPLIVYLGCLMFLLYQKNIDS